MSVYQTIYHLSKNAGRFFKLSNRKNGAVMKNLKKAERAVIALTLFCLIFTAGYFVGRGSAVQVLSFDKLAEVTVSETKSPMAEITASGDIIPTVSEPDVLDVEVSDASPSPIITPSANISIMSPENSGKININTASSAKLDELPGIGPVLAQSIIDYREKIGGFKRIEEIKDVDGIGVKKFNAMKDMISVG